MTDETPKSIWEQLTTLKTAFPLPVENAEGYGHYLRFVESTVRRTIPPFIKNFGLTIQSLSETEKVTQFYHMINQRLPCLNYSLFTEGMPWSVCISSISPTEGMHGVGRYMSDVCSHWLIPGRQLPLTCNNALAVHFEANPGVGYFIHEIVIPVYEKEDLEAIKANISGLISEIRLNILAVQHARSIISMRSLNFYEKKLIIQENIASLLDLSTKEFNQNIFDQMQGFLFKVSSEDKVSKIKEELSPFTEMKPEVFERGIFNELQQLISYFPDEFTALRDMKQLTRIVCYLYLFRKTIIYTQKNNPYKHHLNCKILRTKIYSEQHPLESLSIIIGLNLLDDDEIFEESHVLSAIHSILPDVKKIPNSYIMDRKDIERVRTIYLEVEKDGGRKFTTAEVRSLKANLTGELRSRIQKAQNPIFMPRNEEEVIRNILTLSQQLKYVRDIPQIMIHYLKQTDQTLSFTVIFLRILKKDSIPLKTTFNTKVKNLEIGTLDVKIVGFLRKKYPREANVFEAKIDKKQFLRQDYSLDLFAARQAVFQELVNLFGDLRDFNGGMISKQGEVLDEVKELLSEKGISNDFLLQNYFHGILPVHMQSLLQPQIVAKQFEMILHAIQDKKNETCSYKYVYPYGIYVMTSSDPAMMEKLFHRFEVDLGIKEYLISSTIAVHELQIYTLLISSRDEELCKKASKLIKEHLKNTPALPHALHQPPR